MASAVKEIYDDIATWTPTYDSDVSISAKDVHELPATLASADTPVRLLMVPQGGEGELAFIGLSKHSRIDWTIIDRLYIKPVAQGEGLKKASEKLIDYAVSYITSVRSNRAPTPQSHIADVTITPGIYNWPDTPEGTPFFGVECILTIQEVL